jgi:ribonuclease D
MALLQDPDVCKIFHHAMFDLRFLAAHWSVRATNIVCTKIAAKLLFPNDASAQRLQALTARFLGITLDKTQQKSDWSAAAYDPAQIEYALNDVRHLPSLYDAMTRSLVAAGLLQLAECCYAHIPTRIELELRGFGDVYTY